MRKLNNPLMVYIGFGLFFIVGIFMLYMGFRSVADRMKYTKTTATVIFVETYEDDDEDGGTLGRPIYEYYVDNVRYEKKASYSQSISICPMVGDTITIRYNKNNPSEVNDSPAILTIMFFVFGVVFGGVGGTLFVLSAMGKMHWESSHGRRYRRSGNGRKPKHNGEEIRYDDNENTTYTSSGDVVDAEKRAKENGEMPDSPFNE